MLDKEHPDRSCPLEVCYFVASAWHKVDIFAENPGPLSFHSTFALASDLLQAKFLSMPGTKAHEKNQFAYVLFIAGSFHL